MNVSATHMILCFFFISFFFLFLNTELVGIFQLGENIEPAELEEAALRSSLIQQIVVIGQVNPISVSVCFCSSTYIVDILIMYVVGVHICRINDALGQ